MGNKIGQVAEVGGGVADDVVEALGKDAKIHKIDEISWMKDGELGEMLDPLETKQIHGLKSTKHHQTNE